MKTFIIILKNNYLRTAPRAILVLVMTVITLASIMLAVYVTGIQQVKGHVVLVSQNTLQNLPSSSKYLDIKVLPQKPPHSDLVKQKYDAYVTIDNSGGYFIETLRSNNYKEMISQLLKNPDAILKDSQNDRGVGVNILGFMMMFILMLAFSNLFAFADDKEQGQLLRIAAAPASFTWYLAAHCVYCLSLLLPDFVLLAVLKFCGWDIGFSLFQYAGLITVLGFLGISIALLLNILIKKPDNATMLGNSIIVLTSVLAGSFYSFSKDNAVLDNIIKLLPQREFMSFAQYLQNGIALQHIGSILYVLIFSLTLFVISCSLLRKMYIKNV